MANTANGSPTKEFFVEMLTRDIELNDAILDLLDNCLDGVIRSRPAGVELQDSNYYNSYNAKITISSTKFSICDNCGGIPRKTAEEYAFRMGHGPAQEDHPTIGIYGIGMKRAIFKLGQEAVVHTKHLGNKYSVIIPKNWVSNSENWNFPIREDLKDNILESDGTQIDITTLNPSISELWNTPDKISDYIDRLITAIKESYSLIIQKGFKIEINGIPVEANPVELLVQTKKGDEGVRPYVFKGTYDDVNVKLAVGFYSPMASEDDIDAMNESRRSSYEAGITVVCNDRVVLYNDKSSLTGWGTSGVPNYHTQFIGIKGIVVFESNNPKSLPMTTTKRGIDHSSTIYIAVKDKICEGLKMFTNYTNKWKGRNTQERKYSTQTEKVNYNDLFSENAKEVYGVKVRKDGRGSGEIFRPKLPSPVDDKPTRIIRYTKKVEDIKTLARYYFHDDDNGDIDSSLIGSKAFDEILEKAKSQGV